MLENSTQTESLIVDSGAGSRQSGGGEVMGEAERLLQRVELIQSLSQSVVHSLLSLSLPQSFIHSFIIVEAATITVLNVLKITHLHVLV